MSHRKRFTHQQERRCSWDVLPRDFDAIAEAEKDAVREVLHGHAFDAHMPGYKPEGKSC